MTKLTSDQIKTVETMIKTAVDVATKDLKETIKELKKSLTQMIQILDSRFELTERRVAEIQLTEHTEKPKVEEVTWAEVIKGKKKTKEQIDLINVTVKEAYDRNKKENNLIIFGLKDSKKREGKDRKSEDETELTNMFKSLKAGNVKVEKTYRIKAKDTNKPKPLVVVLGNREDRNKLLLSAKNLKKVNDYKSVYICPDLTEAQRTNFKRLLAERNELNNENKENPLFYFAIREDKIVKLPKLAARSTLKYNPERVMTDHDEKRI